MSIAQHLSIRLSKQQQKILAKLYENIYKYTI